MYIYHYFDILFIILRRDIQQNMFYISKYAAKSRMEVRLGITLSAIRARKGLAPVRVRSCRTIT